MKQLIKFVFYIALLSILLYSCKKCYECKAVTTYDIITQPNDFEPYTETTYFEADKHQVKAWDGLEFNKHTSFTDSTTGRTYTLEEKTTVSCYLME